MRRYITSMLVAFIMFSCIFLSARAQSNANLTINNILVSVKPETAEYEVNVYFSILDSTGSPIKGLTTDESAVLEDAKSMKIDSVSTANEPMTLIMVLDTSGSMAGTGIQAAKDAANSFLLGMGNEDEVSILSFNNNVNQVIDFTKDRQKAGQQLASINAVANSGTCLYNAAYEAVKNAAALPSGRRAVILLTDGVDETNSGTVCSSYTIDDVINLATQGNSAIPVYTIGLGKKIDQQSLQRVADLTGGRFQFTPDSNQLGTMFNNLSDQLKAQYVLKYTTSSAPGNHSLVIQATADGNTINDTRNFLVPEMPTGVLIKSPTDGQIIFGEQTLSAVITGASEGVEKVVFSVGDKVVGEATESPYQVDFEFTSNFSGNTTVQAVAQGANGEEIAKQSISIFISEPTAEGESATELSQTPGASTTPQGKSSTTIAFNSPYVIGAIAVFILIIGGLVSWFLLRKRPKNRIQETTTSSAKVEVEFSDDSGLIHQTFELQAPITRFGRLLSENDICFPQDSAMSRKHAIIEQKDANYFCSEVVQGTTYGTFVNEQKISSTPVVLHNGDVIRLGTRTKLKFIFFSSDITFDGQDFLGGPDEITFDGFNSRKEDGSPFETQDSI
jgi:VWFA-related protein